MGNRVGINYGNTACLKLTPDGGFAAANATGKTNREGAHKLPRYSRVKSWPHSRAMNPAHAR